jgi:anaerobic selenocysteine-containing dehydrogenase
MRTVIGACHHDCPDSCGWVVTVDESGDEPVAVKLRGNPDHPFSKGELCPKVNRYLDRVYSPDRVLTPLRRSGPKGSGQFESISWDEALGEIAARWHAISDEFGGEAIMPMSSAGNQSVLALGAFSRLLDKLGAARLTGSICGATAGAGFEPVYGSRRLGDPESIEHAQLVVLWGTNTRMTNRHLWPYIEAARANGASVVSIDPLRTITADSSDLFIQPLPGTDVALMLAVMGELIRRDVIDHDYIEQFTSGFDELAAECATWSVERAAGTCGITAAEIVALVDLIIAKVPMHVRTLIGSEHREYGASFFRTLGMLPLIMGSWRHRGGGQSRSVGAYAGAMVSDLDRPELLGGRTPRGLSMNQMSSWLNGVEAGETPVKSLFVWNMNPLVTLPNAEASRRGLEREDLFTVVHDVFLTDTARYADIVLPAITHIEGNDIVPSWGSMHLNWNQAAIPPRGMSVSNTELARRLARALGFTEPELLASDEELLADCFSGDADMRGSVTLEQLQRDHVARADVPLDYRPYADGGFATSDGRAHFVSDFLGAMGHGRVPTYRAAHEGPHGPMRDQFPLCLMTPKAHTRFLNSSYSHLPRHAGPEGAPFVELSASDAAARDIADGDTVRVFNNRSSLEVVARIGTMVRDGLVAVPWGWGSSSHVDRKTANALTNDTLADWGGGVAYSDTLVEVERLSGSDLATS